MEAKKDKWDEVNRIIDPKGESSAEKTDARVERALRAIDELNKEILEIQKELKKMGSRPDSITQEDYEKTVSQLQKRLNEAYIRMGEKTKNK